MGYNNILQYLDSDIEILELGFLESAPWPMTKSELVDYAKDNGFPNNLVHAIKNVKDGVYIYDSSIKDFSLDVEEEDDDIDNY